jgi:hypothetical protein
MSSYWFAPRGKLTEGWTDFALKDGNPYEAASPSRPRLGFIKRKRVHSAQMSVILEHCARARHQLSFAICFPLQAAVGFSTICIHLHLSQAMICRIKKRKSELVRAQAKGVPFTR